MRKYTMICKNCGADIGNKGKCEYCDTVYFEEFQQQKAQPGKKGSTKQENRTRDKSGKTKAKLTFPTKVALVLWFICCMITLPEIESIGYFQYFAENAKVLAERDEIMLWDRDRLNKFISA